MEDLLITHGDNKIPNNFWLVSSRNWKGNVQLWQVYGQDRASNIWSQGRNKNLTNQFKRKISMVLICPSKISKATLLGKSSTPFTTCFSLSTLMTKYKQMTTEKYQSTKVIFIIYRSILLKYPSYHFPDPQTLPIQEKPSKTNQNNGRPPLPSTHQLEFPLWNRHRWRHGVLTVRPHSAQRSTLQLRTLLFLHKYLRWSQWALLGQIRW